MTYYLKCSYKKGPLSYPVLSEDEAVIKFNSLNRENWGIVNKGDIIVANNEKHQAGRLSSETLLEGKPVSLEDIPLDGDEGLVKVASCSFKGDKALVGISTIDGHTTFLVPRKDVVRYKVKANS